MNKNSKHKMEHMMCHIIEVRYTDLEEEKRVCHQLLTWSQEQGDDFAKAFALTYLGDYSIAMCELEQAGKYLLEAKELLKEDESWDNLYLRIHSLLGNFYDMHSDEQNAIESYLKASNMAKKLKDAVGECIVLNNLAFVFQRHGCYMEALDYYMEAYTLLTANQELPFRSVLLGNLAEVYLMLHNFEEAKKYIEECELTEKNAIEREIYRSKNWCIYYASLGDKQKAIVYAINFLRHKDIVNEDKLLAFEYYHVIFEKMLELSEQKYSLIFLELMEQVNIGGGLDGMKILEDAKIRYSIIFESSEQKVKAYKRFYEKNQQLRKKANQTIAEAMKSKLYLDELIQQADAMQSEHATLEKEVNIDELTGINNRKFLEAMLRSSYNNQKTENFGIAIMDVDYFKEYNDFYGHLKGDVVLKEIAHCLKDNCLEGIYPCRYGGDEFVCISKGLTQQQMEQYIQQVLTCLKEKKIAHEKSPCSSLVTLSVGYIVVEGMEMEPYVLFQLADKALYQSKENGHNTCTKSRAQLI